jgi:mannan endo-1,6-alpha-mannosidase
MYNYTNASSTWQTRVDGLLASTRDTFFNPEGIIFEQLCEPSGFCNNDQRSFKGYLTRWLAGTTQMAPYTFDAIHPLLENDARAAASVCVGDTAAPAFKGHSGTACGFSWTTPGRFDGSVGVGEQMNALSAVMYTLVGRVAAPVTADTGGTSKGKPDAMEHEEPLGYKEITLGDRVAAGFVTSALALGVVAGSAFVMI